MQNIEHFSLQQKRADLSNLQCRDGVELEYNGLDLPNGVVPPTIIKGKIREVRESTFVFTFENGEEATLAISEVIAI